MDMTDACYRIAVQRRIRELFADRHRLSLRYQEDRAELRALLGVARFAKYLADVAEIEYDRAVERYRLGGAFS